MQVVSLTTEHIFSMGAGGCTRHLLRHLDLETDIYRFLGCIDLRIFTQLETLRLCSWSLYQGPINEIDLDISSVCNLRRLQIENWSPRSIRTAASCRVYAVWQPPLARRVRVHRWLDSPCWRAPGTKLASLHIEDRYPLLHHSDAMLSVVHAILECQHELDILEIATSRLGSREMLLNTLFPFFKGMKTPLRVDLRTDTGCFLHPDDTLCLCETLVLNIVGLVLIPLQATQGKPSTHHLFGYFASGVECALSFTEEQLASYLHASGYVSDKII